jgi:hypothetical protein
MNGKTFVRDVKALARLDGVVFLPRGRLEARPDQSLLDEFVEVDRCQQARFAAVRPAERGEFAGP